MLQYLVKSEGRRLLLELLFAESARGTISELAAQARVGFATAHREVRELHRFGLVIDDQGVFRSNDDHPDVALLRQLVATARRATVVRPPDADEIRQRLQRLGAPLLAGESPVVERDLHDTIVAGVRLARKDPTVARVMPLVLWQQRRNIDPDRLEEVARHARQKHALGFLVALTARLKRSRELEALARRLRDHRVRSRQDFFELPRTRAGQRLAEERSPSVAKDWGFLINMEMSSFAAMFEKFDA